MVTLGIPLRRCLAAAAAAACLAASSHAQTAPGSLFPPLSAAAGAGPSAPETSGKVVIVDFWASWCAPCKAAFPVYSRLQRQFAARGLVIVGVSVDERPSDYSAFVAASKPSFATLLDSQHALVSAVQVPTMPTSYLIDRNGRVRYIHAGFHGEQTERELTKEITALLGEKPQAP
jgi:thiol-disulfide isomerase/thioredoxin